MGRRGSRVAGRRHRAIVLIAAVLVVTSACGNGPATGTLHVYAAASLTEVFGEMGRGFEATHPGFGVAFNFSASSTLARQLIEGAPADVFAAADEATMEQVTDAGAAADPAVMARNRLAVVVERGNPNGIRDVRDLGRADVTFVLCAPQVPCGRLGVAALERAGVAAQPASLEENVKGVVSKVTLGEADAGIAYVTDVQAAGGAVEGVAVGGTESPHLEAVYPIAVVRQAAHVDAARAWMAFVLSPEGQSILARFGFLAP